MAWTLFNFAFDPYDAVVPSMKAAAGAAAGYFLKRVWGRIMGEKKMCLVKHCPRYGASARSAACA